MYSLLYRLFGTLTIRCTGGFAGAFLDRCRLCGVAVRRVNPDSDGLTMEITPDELYLVRHAARQSGMTVHVLRRRGLFLRLAPYRKRYGMAAGMIVFLLLQFALARFVWRVDVLSDSAVYPRETVLAALDEQGIKVGALSDGIDADHAENALLLALPSLKRAAVSLRGSRVTVELADKDAQQTDPPSASAPPIPSDVTAACDGYVVSVYPYSGMAVVSPGDTVQKGQVLISGTFTGPLGRTHLTAAKGEVIAQTVRTTELVLPRTVTEAVPTDRQRTQYELFFYGIRINFCPGGRNPYGSCGIIENHKSLTVLGVDLPVSVQRRVLLEQTERERALTDEELRRDAEEAVRAYEESVLADCTVVERRVSFSADDAAVTLHVTHVCEEDIARPARSAEEEKRGEEFGGTTDQH